MPKVKVKRVCNMQLNKTSLNVIFQRTKRGLYDTGADECTTNDPYIIHNLELLPVPERVTLFFAGKNPHYNFYGGYAILKDSDGEDMKIKMMYTPTLKVTAVDPSKFRNEKLRCLAEMHMQNHQKQLYFHKCVYLNGTHDEIPLF